MKKCELTLNETMHPKSELEMFYDCILGQYEGSVTVFNAKEEIIYFGGRNISNIPLYWGITEEEFNKIHTLQELDNIGYKSKVESSSAAAFRTGKKAAKYTINRNGISQHSISYPVFTENGDLDLVITYTIKETDAEKQEKYFTQEKERYEQTIQFLTDQENASSGVSNFVHESQEMEEVLMQARYVAPTDSRVFIYGESGTGKEVLARYIHEHSLRADRPFIDINCAAVPNELIEAELFGYEKGAFTGASKNGKPGLFELADQGTLFLDEVGEMPSSMQSKLLRVLETGDVRRIGGSKTRHVDVRIISATNADLLGKVENKTFRKDLYYRICIFPILIPPLRERKNDIIPLAESFLEQYCRKYGAICELSKDDKEALKAYNFPGNVRELRNIIERMVITNGQLPSDVFQSSNLKQKESSAAYQYNENLSLKENMKKIEQIYVKKAVEECDGDVATAAARLKMPISTLYQKLQGIKRK